MIWADLGGNLLRAGDFLLQAAHLSAWCSASWAPSSSVLVQQRGFDRRWSLPTSSANIPDLALVRLTWIIHSPPPWNQSVRLGWVSVITCQAWAGLREGGCARASCVLHQPRGSTCSAAATPSAERPEPLGSLTRRGGHAMTNFPRETRRERLWV